MMEERTTIRIVDIIESPFAVANDDGQLVREAIEPCLRQGRPVALLFSGLQVVIGAFLLAIVGPLYERSLLGLLSFDGLSDNDRAMLDRVIENVKAYHRNPAAFDAAWLEIIEEETLEAK